MKTKKNKNTQEKSNKKHISTKKHALARTQSGSGYRRKFLHFLANGSVISERWDLTQIELHTYHNKKKKHRKFSEFFRKLPDFQKAVVVYALVSTLLIVSLGAYFVGRILYVSLTHDKYDHNNLSAVLKQPNNITMVGDGMIASPNGDYFVFQNNADNNYVYYSGNIYRILTMDYDGSITIISDQPVSSYLFTTKAAEFKDTEIYRWLNYDANGSIIIDDILDSGVFYNSLYKPEEYLKPAVSFCTLSDQEGNCLKTTEATVGLLNINQYLEAGASNSFLNNGNYFWTLSYNEQGSIYTINSEGSLLEVVPYGVTTVECYGIRPVLVLKPNTKFLSGEGTADEPYLVADQEYLATKGETLLNQRFSGEYVLFSDTLYRIVTTNAKYTELIMEGVIDEEEDFDVAFSASAYDNNMFDSTKRDNLAYFLNHSYFDSLADNHLLVNGVNYIGTFSDQSQYQYKAQFQEVSNEKISLPKIGGLYNTNLHSEIGYWTIDVYNLNGYQVVTLNQKNQAVVTLITQKRQVKTVIYISSEAVIDGGSGLSGDPYTIK